MTNFAAMQKTLAFYHDKVVDLLKLGFALPKLTSICLHKSTDANFSQLQLMEEDKEPSENF